MRLTGVIAGCAVLIDLVLASRGDQLVQFADCVEKQVSERCAPDGVDYKTGPLPLHLRILQWTCVSDSDHLCQRSVTEGLVQTGRDVEQFHGKWPFIRIGGIQEPASVVFSLMNGYVHYSGLKLIRRRVSTKSPMRPYYIAFPFIGMNAWLWSTVFHTRDFPATEKLDYFSAGTYVLFGLFYSTVRVFRLYDYSDYYTIVKVWGLLCISALACHISYLSFVVFDYGYNMLANVIVGSVHGLFWIYYSLRFHKGRPTWVWTPTFVVVVLAGAMCLELFDFPPFWYAIDAHSLWHLSTVPITWIWYRFLVKDAEWELNSSKKRKS